VKALVLKLPDFDKDFEIHFDASNFAIGGVIVQDGRPVAFESKKSSETERRWPTLVMTFFILQNKILQNSSFSTLS
jgi:hypothetical protein